MGQIKKQIQINILDDKSSRVGMIMSQYFFNWLIFEARSEIQKYCRWFFWFKWILWYVPAFEVNWPLKINFWGSMSTSKLAWKLWNFLFAPPIHDSYLTLINFSDLRSIFSIYLTLLNILLLCVFWWSFMYF